MISKIRNSLLIRFLYGFMAIYFLNISVDIADLNPQYVDEDLSFNDQESIIEFFVEKVLGYDDTFQEIDDVDYEESYSKKIENKTWISTFIIYSIQNFIIQNITSNQRNYDYQEINSFDFVQQISPPPEV